MDYIKQQYNEILKIQKEWEEEFKANGEFTPQQLKELYDLRENVTAILNELPDITQDEIINGFSEVI